MPDREKIKKALERCLICDMSVIATEEAQKAYLECEYTVGLYCGQKKVLQDALELLKEQEEEIENLKQTAQSMMEGICLLKEQEDMGKELTDAMELIHKKNERIKNLEEQIETLTKWRANAGAFD